jgi:hypothetical protein
MIVNQTLYQSEYNDGSCPYALHAGDTTSYNWHNPSWILIGRVAFLVRRNARLTRRNDFGSGRSRAYFLIGFSFEQLNNKGLNFCSGLCLGKTEIHLPHHHKLPAGALTAGKYL